jgi:ribosomal protein S18 acetylase RimI-like enzyme
VQWRIDPDAPVEAASAVLASDRLWSTYSLADLEPPWRAYSRVALAEQAGGPARAALTLFRHPSFTSIIPHGDPEGLAALLSALADPDPAATGAGPAPALPAQTFVLVRPEHLEALGARYDFPRPHPMLRMAVDAASFLRPAGPFPAVERLGDADVAALRELYAEYPESAFVPDMLDGGVFYGRRDGGRLVAAAGTHVVGRRAGIAALGNVFVRPEARRSGYALAVSAAVTAELLAGPCRDVVLNVAVANEPAQRVYRRLGFRAHCSYFEGVATARASPSG